MESYLSLHRTIAHDLANAIYNYIDHWGISEMDGVVDLLAGETSIEQFIGEIEAALAEAKKA